MKCPHGMASDGSLSLFLSPSSSLPPFLYASGSRGAFTKEGVLRECVKSQARYSVVLIFKVIRDEGDGALAAYPSIPPPRTDKGSRREEQSRSDQDGKRTTAHCQPHCRAARGNGAVLTQDPLLLPALLGRPSWWQQKESLLYR